MTKIELLDNLRAALANLPLPLVVHQQIAGIFQQAYEAINGEESLHSASESLEANAENQ